MASCQSFFRINDGLWPDSSAESGQFRAGLIHSSLAANQIPGQFRYLFPVIYVDKARKRWTGRGWYELSGRSNRGPTGRSLPGEDLLLIGENLVQLDLVALDLSLIHEDLLLVGQNLVQLDLLSDGFPSIRESRRAQNCPLAPAHCRLGLHPLGYFVRQLYDGLHPRRRLALWCLHGPGDWCGFFQRRYGPWIQPMTGVLQFNPFGQRPAVVLSRALTDRELPGRSSVKNPRTKCRRHRTAPASWHKRTRRLRHGTRRRSRGR